MADFLDFMIQHALYLKDLEQCVREQTACIHERADECAFGEMYYAEIKPRLASYPETERVLLEHLEKVHLRFHEAASKIHSEDFETDPNYQAARRYSLELMELLDRLEKQGFRIVEAVPA